MERMSYDGRVCLCLASRASGLRAHRGSGAIYTRRPRRAWYKMERSDFPRGAFRSGILARRCAKARQT
nr:MAG TPA: hypothetical protein [Microviridae sp.]